MFLKEPGEGDYLECECCGAGHFAFRLNLESSLFGFKAECPTCHVVSEFQETEWDHVHD